MTASDRPDDASITAGPVPQPTGQPTGPIRPQGRWVRVALAVSLAINLAVAGIVAGAVLRDGGPMHNKMMTGDLGFGPFTDALLIDDRAALRSAFLAAAPDMRDTRRAMRADFTDLLAQLRMVPFDADALRAAFDRQNTRTSDRLQLGQRLIFDLLIGMDDASRQAFAERLEKNLSRGPKRRDGPEKP